MGGKGGQLLFSTFLLLSQTLVRVIAFAKLCNRTPTEYLLSSLSLMTNYVLTSKKNAKKYQSNNFVVYLSEPKTLKQ